MIKSQFSVEKIRRKMKNINFSVYLHRFKSSFAAPGRVSEQCKEGFFLGIGHFGHLILKMEQFIGL